MRVTFKGVCIALAVFGAVIGAVVVVGVSLQWAVYFVTTMGLTP